MMDKQKAISMLRRIQDPEPYEPKITDDAYYALEMGIRALEECKTGKWIIEIEEEHTESMTQEFLIGFAVAVEQNMTHILLHL